MNKETKIVLLVVASLVGLIVIGFGALVAILGVTFSHQIHDATPASNAADAAKIASFTLPKGYRYLLATNVFVVNMVTIVPDDPTKRGFTIVLEGMATPNAAEGTGDDDAVRRGFSNGAGCAGSAVTDETVRTRSGRDVVLHAQQCGGAAPRGVIYAKLPSHYPIAYLLAGGPRDVFDRAAVRSLVASIR